MFIPDPDLYPFRIVDPGFNNSNKRGGGTKFVVLPYFVAKNITKLKLSYFSIGKDKNSSQITKNDRTFYSKNCH
jgi:hypothetical protein